MYPAKTIIRALRLPFLSASILPFVFGSLIVRQHFNLIAFFLGLITVGLTHLSANLINDYADSKSGADWQDKDFYVFFGGSKLIQEHAVPEQWYLKTAILCAALACACVAFLSVAIKSFLVPVLFAAIIFLSWAYSRKPLQFAYKRMGECIVFLLFGPCLVMGGYYIQTRIFPDYKSFLLSLPFGLLTTAILFANEVPDYSVDSKSGKFTWVSLTGPRHAFIIYVLLMGFAFGLIGFNIAEGNVHLIALVSFVLIIPALKAARILQRDYADKKRLMESSRITIAVQALASIALLLGVLV